MQMSDWLERFEPHEEFLGAVLDRVQEYGYRVERLEPDGYRPDGQVWLPCKGSEFPYWIDAKTRKNENLKFSVEMDAIHAYTRLTAPGFVVWGNWHVDTAESLMGRMSGPRAPTGRGSSTWWHLVEPGGESFELVFPRRGS